MLRFLRKWKSALIFVDFSNHETVERVPVNKINAFIAPIICAKFHDFMIF